MVRSIFGWQLSTTMVDTGTSKYSNSLGLHSFAFISVFLFSILLMFDLEKECRVRGI